MLSTGRLCIKAAKGSLAELYGSMYCTYGTGKDTGLLFNASDLIHEKRLLYLTIK